MNIYTFITSSIIIILIPGTGVIYTVATGLTKGKKSGVIAAVGCTVGIVPHLCVSILLSSLILKFGDYIFSIMKVIGALYLIYLGFNMLLNKAVLDFEKTESNDKAIDTIRQGVLINLLNPKLTLFFFSFLPQYVSENSNNYILDSIMYGLIFMSLTFIVFVAYGVFAGKMRTLVYKSPKVLRGMQWTFGIIFILFAIQLAVSTL
ncbi:MAG: LysE family translocator [Candidatus Metalachnospira sp.]|nr:LysE family translocator [Bacteroidaceae bacterium]MEA4973556.1 LysE family translocator [Candidatus Metalachnospira sp.]